MRITEIPRAGVITDVHIEHALAAGLPLANALAQASATTTEAVTPEQLHRLGEATGYHVGLTWGNQPGTLDAVFFTPTKPPTDPHRQHTAPLTDLYLPPTEAHTIQHPRQRPAHQHQDQRGASAAERAVARLHGAGPDPRPT